MARGLGVFEFQVERGGVPVSNIGEADTSTCEMPEEPSADEARGKLRNIKSPTSARAPAGLNRRTFTPSS